MSDPQSMDGGWSPSVLGALTPGSTAASPAAQACASPAVDVQEERQKGYDAGFAEGLATGRAKAEGLAQEMAALLHAMAAPFQDSDAVLLREILSLTERVARAVIRRELQAGADVEQVLTDALEALGSVSIPVQLTLNPADAALCRDLGLLPNERFELLENDSLGRGGLQLRAGHSFVDASVESRLESALAGLRADAGLPEDDVLEASTPTPNDSDDGSTPAEQG